MEIEIYPQMLRNSLDTMNQELAETIERAQSYISSIEDYIGTTDLTSIAFGSQKDYMNRGHLTAVRGQLIGIQAVIAANSMQSSCIDEYLCGVTYLSED